MSGIDRIAAERRRQIDVEGWGPQHDDRYQGGELVTAARLYAEAAVIVEHSPQAVASVRRRLEYTGGDPAADEDLARMIENPARHYHGWDRAPREWPLAAELWKPSPDAARNLDKAGALLAAEIDRLERLGVAPALLTPEELARHQERATAVRNLRAQVSVSPGEYARLVAQATQAAAAGEQAERLRAAAERAAATLNHPRSASARAAREELLEALNPRNPDV